MSFQARRCDDPSCGLRYPSPVGRGDRPECPVCEATTTRVAGYDAPTQPAPAIAGHPVVGVLDSIRSALNVGTMLRAADGAGAQAMYLCGLTAWIDNPKVIKTALGAEASVACHRRPDVERAVEELQHTGHTVWALETTSTSQPIDTMPQPDGPIALVAGNEVAGVDPGVLERADAHVHLPMVGAKSTLNVGVAFGTALYVTTGVLAVGRRV